MAMRLAGLVKIRQTHKERKIIRDSRGYATGVFIDAAEGYVNSIIPPDSDLKRTLAFEKALEQMAKEGITSGS